MALPTSFYGQSIYDSTVKGNGQPESSSWSVPVHTLTAANYVAQSALIAALASAVAALLLGNLHQHETVIERILVSDLPAASQLAQRENKLLLRYHDVSTLEKFRVSLPTFDLTQLPLHSEFLDLTAGNGQALKTAFEAIVLSPNGANAVLLDSAQFVGRNT